MKKRRKGFKILLVCLSLLTIGIISIKGKTGWSNEGWSNIDWAGKACNSKTTVYDLPKYEYMSATAKIGTKSEKMEASDPSPNLSVHAWTVSGYQETCNYWGNVY